MQWGDMDRGQNSQSSDPSIWLGSAFGSLQATVPANLAVLRKMAKELLTCPPKQAALRIIEEYRFLIGKTKSLSEQFRTLHDKRLAQYMEIKESCELTVQLYEDLQNLFTQQIKKWFESEKEKGFEVASKGRGVPLLQEFKKLEDQFNFNLKKFKNLSPASLIDNLKKENAEMKRLLQDPSFAQKAESAIKREIAMLKERYQSQLNKAFQSKQNAENQYFRYSNEMGLLFQKANSENNDQKDYNYDNLRHSMLKTLIDSSQKKQNIEMARYEELLKAYSTRLLALIDENQEQINQKPQELKPAIRSAQFRIKYKCFSS